MKLVLAVTVIALAFSSDPLVRWIYSSPQQYLKSFAVDAQFAYDEGEDDRTLESWQREHWKYFSQVLPKIGKKPNSEMLLVCERFRIVYQ